MCGNNAPIYEQNVMRGNNAPFTNKTSYEVIMHHLRTKRHVW